MYHRFINKTRTHPTAVILNNRLQYLQFISLLPTTIRLIVPIDISPNASFPRAIMIVPARNRDTSIFEWYSANLDYCKRAWQSVTEYIPFTPHIYRRLHASK